jgi:hypothetical protein
MYSAPRNFRAVVVLLMASLYGTVAFPQAAKFIRRTADPIPLADMPLGRAPCTREPGSAAAESNAATVASSDPGAPCDTPPLKAPVVNPCNPASPAQIGCPTPRDPVQEDLARMGKAGQKILRAREKVFEILQTENACSAWFREKDSNPAATFRTLSFEVDRKGEQFVLKSTDRSNMIIFRNPYVAWVIQGDGRYATITINTNGAFFSPVANMVEVWKEGGPANFRGSHRTNVGPYSGDTIHAQVLTLLHEFGHVLDLLPADENNVDGKSVQNTNEVLRYCRAEIESKGRRGALLAAR